MSFLKLEPEKEMKGIGKEANESNCILEATFPLPFCSWKPFRFKYFAKSHLCLKMIIQYTQKKEGLSYVDS
jgi:hypothetical protein